MAASHARDPISLLVLSKLSPSARLKVKLPDLVQSLVQVVLAAEDVQGSVTADTRVASPRGWARVGCGFENVPREILNIEGVHFVFSITVEEAAENDDLVTVEASRVLVKAANWGVCSPGFHQVPVHRRHIEAVHLRAIVLFAMHGPPDQVHVLADNDRLMVRNGPYSVVSQVNE